MLVDPRRGGDTGAPCGWRKRAGRGGSPGRLVAPREGERPGLRRPGSRRGEAAPTGCWSTRDRGTAGVLVDPGGRAAAAGPRGPRGQLVDRIHQEGRREGGARARARARAPSDLAGPSGRGGPRGRPRRRPSACRAEAPRLSPPSPSQPGASAPAGKEGVSVPGAPTRQAPSGGVSAPPPTLRLAGKRARERKDGATDADGMGWDGKAAASPQPPCPAPPRPAPPGPRLPPRQGRRDAGGTEEEDRTGQDRTGPDKPLCRGLTFNRSQRGSCSATYETPTQKQVVYEWFSTRFPTNVRCVTGEGAAPFPAAPRFPGRGALRTGPRSRRAAGHAAPRGARAAARRRGRRGTGYPRPTEAPRRCRIVPPGRDSDLEAFSHNPTDGSFAPLAPQPSTYTKCLNLRFLSY